MDRIGVSEDSGHGPRERGVRRRPKRGRTGSSRGIGWLGMSEGSRRFAKPAAAFGVLATMASIWWFALRPRRRIDAEAKAGTGTEASSGGG
jgi:hypothetical protein